MRSLWGVFRSAVSSWWAHNPPRLGAALAFYTALSLAPLLVILVAIAGTVFGEQAVRGQIYWHIRNAAGSQSAAVVQSLLRDAAHPGKSGIFASVFGFVMLLAGASGVFAELQDDLNAIWKTPSPQISTLRTALSHYLSALTMVVGAGLLLVLSLIMSFAIHAASSYSMTWMVWPAWLLESLNFVITLAMTTFLFALIYRFFPARRVDWEHVVGGALVTAVLFVIGKSLVGFYLAKAGIGSTYGAAGSLVVLLVWVYYSSQLFLLGAEFTQVWAQRKTTDR